MGEGKFLKRGIYPATRILITPDYNGKNTLNASEILGRAISQGISRSELPQFGPDSGPTAGEIWMGDGEGRAHQCVS
jgi:hypothetical protein